MNEGRADLERVIVQYEKQRAEAIRSQQEADIVLPYVRAAVEELDKAHDQSEMDTQESEGEGTKPALQAMASDVEEGDEDAGVETDEAEEADKDKPSMSRSSIASLIEQAGNKRKTG